MIVIGAVLFAGGTLLTILGTASDGIRRAPPEPPAAAETRRYVTTQSDGAPNGIGVSPPDGSRQVAARRRSLRADASAGSLLRRCYSERSASRSSWWPELVRRPTSGALDIDAPETGHSVS